MSGTVTYEFTGAGVRNLKVFSPIDLKVVLGRFTFDSSYQTGGEVVDLSDYFEEVPVVFTTNLCTAMSSTAAKGFMVHYLPSTDASAGKFVALGSSAQNANAGALGLCMQECVSGTDLSAWTTRFIAIGV